MLKMFGFQCIVYKYVLAVFFPFLSVHRSALTCDQLFFIRKALFWVPAFKFCRKRENWKPEKVSHHFTLSLGWLRLSFLLRRTWNFASRRASVVVRKDSGCSYGRIYIPTVSSDVTFLQIRLRPLLFFNYNYSSKTMGWWQRWSFFTAQCKNTSYVYILLVVYSTIFPQLIVHYFFALMFPFFFL